MFYDVFGPSWSPLAEMERMLGDVARLGRARPTGANALNVWASDEAVAVTVEVPGLRAEDLSLSIVGDTLTLGGKRPSEADAGSDSAWHRREREAYEFSRTIQLPFAVDADHAEARLKDGVLTVALRRVEADKPRKIAVNAN